MRSSPRSPEWTSTRPRPRLCWMRPGRERRCPSPAPHRTGTDHRQAGGQSFQGCAGQRLHHLRRPLQPLVQHRSGGQAAQRHHPAPRRPSPITTRWAPTPWPAATRPPAPTRTARAWTPPPAASASSRPTSTGLPSRPIWRLWSATSTSSTAAICPSSAPRHRVERPVGLPLPE